MISSMELVLASIGIQNELIVITIEMLTLMRGGFNFINIICILPILLTIHILHMSLSQAPK